MRRVKTKRKAIRWTNWASRLTSRFDRYAHAFRVDLLLRANGNRTSLLVQQRWLRPILDSRLQLHLSIACPQFSQLHQVFAKHTSVATPPHTTFAVTNRPETVLVRHTSFALATTLHRHSLTRILDSRMELQKTVQRHSLERTEVGSPRTSERLILRTQRTEHRTAFERSMTLRRDFAPMARPATEFLPNPHASSSEIANRTFSAQRQQSAMPQINVDQLADQVIHQIDRRIIARRERMGRT